MRSFAILALGVIFISGCSRETPSTLATGGYDEKEMDVAIADARKSIDRFLAELKNPTGDSHAVKVPVVDGEHTEHFWMSDLKVIGGEFRGVINNEPAKVTNVKLGQSWSIKVNEVSDWMYMKDGKIVGNYTLRPLLKNMPDDEAESIRGMLAEL